MKMIATLAAFFTLSLLPVAMRAQNPPEPAAASPQHFYHVRFAVAEIDASGKVTNTRSYEETICTTGGHAVGDQQIKTGSRVPIATGSYGANTNLANTQFQYIDLGVNLDVRDAVEHGDKLNFRLRAEISSIAHQTEIAGIGEPVIRQNSWDSLVAIPVGKPTVVFSSDDLDSKGKMQVEVTATRVE
jgi:Bacterial type II and III secretion system protein